MKINETFQWLRQGQRRQRVILKLGQPMTVKQLARHADLTPDACGAVLWELNVYGLVECLNPQARRCRLYWLTPCGRDCRSFFLQQTDQAAVQRKLPAIDCWALYGEVCHRHRSAVIRTFAHRNREPMQPSQVRRVACQNDSGLRMSANNTRDVIRWLHENDLVQRLRRRKRSHPRYVLTERGEAFRGLLEHAEAGS